MKMFSVRPLSMAFCVVLAGVHGAANAEERNRFDGVWVGQLHNVFNCSEREILLSVEGNRLKTVIGGREVNTEVDPDGRVSWSARARTQGWGPIDVYFSGRFTDFEFEGRYAGGGSYSCRAVVTARLRKPTAKPATTADSGGATAAPPAPEPATPRAADAPSASATTLATAPAPPQAESAGPYDGEWKGTVSYCTARKTITLRVVDGRFEFAGKIGGLRRFAGRIDSLTGEITGHVIRKAGWGSMADTGSIKGRARQRKLSAKGNVWACPVEIALDRQGRTVAAAPSAPAVESVPTPAVQARPAVAADDRAPAIDLPGAVTARGAVVEIAGRVRDDSRIAELTVDGRPIGIAADGSFRVRRVVPVGTSSLRVVALDEWGNKAESSVSVTRKPASVAPATPRAVPRDTTPPVIAVPSAIETESAVIELAGALADDSTIVEFSVEGRPVAVGPDGGFKLRRGVPFGESRLTLTAIDAWGNRAERQVRVTRHRLVERQVAAPGDTTPPVIDVPVELETDKTVVTLAGKVTDASRVVELTLDGRPLTLDGDGGFSARREVALGASVLKLAAVDEWGNRSEQPVQVTRLSVAEALGIDFGRYHALVIGNDDYRDLPNLKTAVADARAVAKALRQDYGFEVDLLENATEDQIKTSISRLRRTLTEKDNLLVYYAGHGVVDAEVEEGFWLPVDAERDSDANWIANSYLSRNLRALNAKHVMVVADSCYSGTLVRAASVQLRSARERAAWLARMAAKRSRTALVSGGLEPVMDSGGGGHSVFARAFLAALADNDGVIDGQSLFEKVERPVILNSDQTPDYADIRRAGHDGGEFLFVRR